MPRSPNAQRANRTAAPELVRIPAAEATRFLRATVRLVADIPADAPLAVVWTHGASELRVDLDGVRLACAPGLATITLLVSCDQWAKPTPVDVPLAVGTAERTAGLVAAAFDRLAAPPVIAALWSEALTAFAWEALLQLAQELSGRAGKDAAGRPLVPASIAAEQDLLLVQPMARHDLGLRITG